MIDESAKRPSSVEAKTVKEILFFFPGTRWAITGSQGCPDSVMPCFMHA
jgi:hypothetical protein